MAVVSFILVCLALLSGWMDLRSLDKTLMGYIERSGLNVVADVEETTRRYVDLLAHRPPPRLSDFSVPDYGEVPFSLGDAMIVGLMDLIRDMDRALMDGRLKGDELSSVANEEGLWLLALYGARGDLVFSNRPVPPFVRHGAEPVILGKERVLIHLFHPLGRGKENGGMRWLAVKTGWKSGTTVLALDRSAFLFWQLRTAVQAAMEDVRPRAEIGYMVVTDERGRLLGGTADMPEEPADGIPPYDRKMDADTPVSRKVRVAGEAMVEISAPIRFENGLSGLVRVAISRDLADQMLAKEKRRGILWVSFMVCIALISMWLLYKNQNRHLKRMREAAQRLHQAQRLSALGRMAAGVAHEIRNPLNAISMATQRLKKENIDQLSPMIRDEIRRLDRIIEDFLSLSGHREMILKPHDIRALLDQVVLLMEQAVQAREGEIHRDWGDAPLMVQMDKDRMKQAILNIIKNAVEAIPLGGVVTVSASQVSKEWVKVQVSDNGGGLSPDEVGRMFNPDYTTKERGLGLGLPLAHEIVHGHGGEIRVRSDPGEGTRVEIRLPLARYE
ncbi:MAG: ATP-binding protein [Deltaproteobacteria bacterium]|nr:ATP-binding protein [Deltaproteobacteria bacterium]